MVALFAVALPLLAHAQAFSQFMRGDIDGDGIRDHGVRGFATDYPAVRVVGSVAGPVVVRSPFHDLAYFGQSVYGDGQFMVVRGYSQLPGGTVFTAVDTIFSLASRTPVASFRVIAVDWSFNPSANAGAGGLVEWTVNGQPASLAAVVAAASSGAQIGQDNCVPTGGGWLCFYEVIVPCGVDCGLEDPGAGVPPNEIDPPGSGGGNPPIEDCDGDGIPDDDQIDQGLAWDCDGDGLLDICEPDCDGDGLPDDCELDLDGNGVPDDCENPTADCPRVDIDVDAKFDGLPDGEIEDLAETNAPGRVVFVNGCSTDGDDKPDYCDGFDGLLSADLQDSDYWTVNWSSLTPVHIAFSPGVRRFRIDILGNSGSSAGAPADPGSVVVAGNHMIDSDDWRVHVPAAGAMRLWRKWNEVESRSSELAPAGHAVPVGVWQSWNAWSGFSIHHSLSLLAEGLRASAAIGDITIKVTAEYPKRDGPGVDTCVDTVRLTVARVATYDLRHWGPAPSSIESDAVTISETNLHVSRSNDQEVLGSLADGASLCLFRVEPNLLGTTLGRQVLASLSLRIRAARVQPNDASLNYVGILGSLHAPYGPSGTGPLTLPVVPIESLTQDGRDVQMAVPQAVGLGAGAVIYRAASEFIDGRVNYGVLGLPQQHFTDPTNGFQIGGDAPKPTSGARPHFVLSIEVVQPSAGGGPARCFGGTEFHILRPPLVLVHGICSSAATWQPPLWCEQPTVTTDGFHAGFATRIRRVEYGSTSVMGFWENYTKLSATIERTLEAYRDPFFVEWAENLPAVPHPANGSLGQRFAATRVDAVGHSQGGQLIRWYAAEFRHQTGPASSEVCGVNAEMTREQGFPPMKLGKQPASVKPNPTADSGFNVAYIRPDNWMSGTIRRAITVGSPFLGSHLADYARERVKNDAVGFFGNDLQNAEFWAQVVNGLYTYTIPPSVQAQVRAWFFPNNPTGDVFGSHFIAPTCAHDLSFSSWCQRLLFGMDFDQQPASPPELGTPHRHYYCRFPAGRRAVAISFLGGTMDNWPQATVVDWTTAATLIGTQPDGQAIVALSWGGTGFLAYLEAKYENEISNWPAESDLIVHEASQSFGTVLYPGEWVALAPPDQLHGGPAVTTGAFRKFDPLAHLSLLLFVGETSSVHICDWTHRLLYTRSETEFRSTPGLNPTPSRFVPLWPFAVPLNQQEHGGQYVP